MTVERNSFRSLLHVDDVGNRQKWRAGWRPWTLLSGNGMKSVLRDVRSQKKPRGVAPSRLRNSRTHPGVTPASLLRRLELAPTPELVPGLPRRLGPC